VIKDRKFRGHEVGDEQCKRYAIEIAVNFQEYIRLCSMFDILQAI
jgi:hypothetical protein